MIVIRWSPYRENVQFARSSHWRVCTYGSYVQAIACTRTNLYCACSRRPRTYPPRKFPTNPFRSRGLAALGSSRGECYLCRYNGQTFCYVWRHDALTRSLPCSLSLGARWRQILLSSLDRRRKNIAFPSILNAVVSLNHLLCLLLLRCRNGWGLAVGSGPVP